MSEMSPDQAPSFPLLTCPQVLAATALLCTLPSPSSYSFLREENLPGRPWLHLPSALIGQDYTHAFTLANV